MVELTNKVVKCRVKHRCIWCGEFIYPMQKAVYGACMAAYSEWK